MEEWMIVPGHANYVVSNMGVVMRLPHRSPKGRWLEAKVLKPTPTGDGHLQVGLNGKLTTVHSIVLLAFVGPRPEGMPQIRHLNDDPSDNRLTNICYGTVRENAEDREIGMRSRATPRFSASRTAAIERALLEKSAWTYKELGELGAEHGVCCKTVIRIREKLAFKAQSLIYKDSHFGSAPAL